jgi:hypothetical protein
MITTRGRTSKIRHEWSRLDPTQRAGPSENGSSRRQSTAAGGKYDRSGGADARGSVVKQWVELYSPSTTDVNSDNYISWDFLERLVPARSSSLASRDRSTASSSISSDTPTGSGRPRGPWSITSVNRKPLPRTSKPYRHEFDASSLASSNRNASQSSLAYDDSNAPPSGPRFIPRIIRKPVPRRAGQSLLLSAPDTTASRLFHSKDTHGFARSKRCGNTSVASWITRYPRQITENYRYRRRPQIAAKSRKTIRWLQRKLGAGTRSREMMEYQGCDSAYTWEAYQESKGLRW